MYWKRAVLWKIDEANARLHQLLALPSSGDTGYPGLVWHKGSLWMSYYSAHERRASIYLAEIEI